MTYTTAQRQYLLQLAHDSISHGLHSGRPLTIEASEVESELWRPRASFVTLHKLGQLRGCIGSLEAHRPLAEDVCENAFAAAFRDPRFNAVNESELEQLQIDISVLTPATPMQFSSQQQLIDQLQPGIDGLILQEGGRRGTFLPSVWEQLPDASQFLQHLKLKAGLPADYWSDSIKISRYTTELIA